MQWCHLENDGISPAPNGSDKRESRLSLCLVFLELCCCCDLNKTFVGIWCKIPKILHWNIKLTFSVIILRCSFHSSEEACINLEKTASNRLKYTWGTHQGVSSHWVFRTVYLSVKNLGVDWSKSWCERAAGCSLFYKKNLIKILLKILVFWMCNWFIFI